MTTTATNATTQDRRSRRPARRIELDGPVVLVLKTPAVVAIRPRSAAVESPAQPAVDAKLAEARVRAALVQRWIAYWRSRQTDGWTYHRALTAFFATLCRELGAEAPSLGTLQRWTRRYKAGGVAALIDRRGAARRAASDDADASVTERN